MEDISHRMAGRTAGRPSNKKQKIFDVYAVLRCSMMHDDVKELLRKYPGFHDRTMNDTDTEIQNAIYVMVEAMIAVQPPDLSDAEPLRR